MNCDECGDGIFVGDEYWHDKERDLNFHLSCVPMVYEETDPMFKLEKRYKEE